MSQERDIETPDGRESTRPSGSGESGEPVKSDGWGIALALIGALTVANGIWMWIDPGHWYEHLPAGVPDTGPLNIHFVRDIGCAFATIGVALLWSWRRPKLRYPLVAVSAIFLILHAALHIHDTARGLLDTHHWALDLPGVYAPALVLGIATFRLARQRGSWT